MKIGHYMPGMWRHGGIASYIQRVSTAQMQAGHSVVYFDSLPHALSTGHESSLVFVRDAHDLHAQARARDVDILHAHVALPGPFPRGIPVIRTVHVHTPYCPSGTKYLRRQGAPCERAYSVAGCAWGHLIDRCGSRRPRNIIADIRQTRGELVTLRDIPAITVSTFLRKQMIRSGYRPDLLHVLHLPSPEVGAYGPSPYDGTPHFVFLGRLVPQKGVDWLLRALQHIRTPIHVDIAGDGYQEADLRVLADRLGVADRVSFHGWVGEEDAARLIASARALLVPSVWHEPGCTVAFEAMANERAIIAGRVGGIPEIVLHGENGLLVDPNDTVGLARAIERLAEDYTLAQRLGETGRQRVATMFTLNDHIDNLLQLYGLYVSPRPSIARITSISPSLQFERKEC